MYEHRRPIGELIKNIQARQNNHFIISPYQYNVGITSVSTRKNDNTFTSRNNRIKQNCVSTKQKSRTIRLPIEDAYQNKNKTVTPLRNLQNSQKIRDQRDKNLFISSDVGQYKGINYCRDQQASHLGRREDTSLKNSHEKPIKHTRFKFLEKSFEGNPNQSHQIKAQITQLQRWQSQNNKKNSHPQTFRKHINISKGFFSESDRNPHQYNYTKSKTSSRQESEPTEMKQWNSDVNNTNPVSPKKNDHRLICYLENNHPVHQFKRKKFDNQSMNRDSQSTNCQNIFSQQLNNSEIMRESQESLLRAQDEEEKQEQKLELNKVLSIDNLVAVSQEFEKCIQNSLTIYFDNFPLRTNHQQKKYMQNSLVSPWTSIPEEIEIPYKTQKINQELKLEFNFDDKSLNTSKELLEQLKERNPLPAFKRKKSKYLGELF